MVFWVLGFDFCVGDGVEKEEERERKKTQFFFFFPTNSTHFQVIAGVPGVIVNSKCAVTRTKPRVASLIGITGRTTPVLFEERA